MRYLALIALPRTALQPVRAESPLRLIPSDWSRQQVLAVPFVRQPPVIDGHVGFKEWLYAAHTSAFLNVDTGFTPA